jgi:nitroimidazol reductase NimA-like FMN-containing flavoprotein (pyridoxamine 5'-phosphate oxidase superfamily)
MPAPEHAGIMTATLSPVTPLTVEQCWDLLSSTSFGRLGTSAAGSVDITPISYLVDAGTILFQSDPGTKLVHLALEGAVALEIDSHGPYTAWSVVVKGRARMLTDRDDIARADALGSVAELALDRPHWVRIDPVEVTGRHFMLDGAQGPAGPR